MAITKEQVLEVAKMARLRLTPEEVERFTVQLDAILSHMEELRAVDVEGIAGVGDATEGVAPLRPQEQKPDALQSPIASFAPEWEDGFFTVPRLAALDTVELEDSFEDKARAGSVGRPSPEALGGGGA